MKAATFVAMTFAVLVAEVTGALAVIVLIEFVRWIGGAL